MADYDSATPLYQFLPNHWDDPNRGKIPLAWGINPNLIETYPDVVSYLYRDGDCQRHFHGRCQRGGLHESEPGAEGVFAAVRRAQQEVLSGDRHDDRSDGARLGPAVERREGCVYPVCARRICHDRDGPARHRWEVLRHPRVERHARDQPDQQRLQFRQARSRRRTSCTSSCRPSRPCPGFFFFRIVWVGPTQILQTLRCCATSIPTCIRAGRSVYVLSFVQRAL